MDLVNFFKVTLLIYMTSSEVTQLLQFSNNIKVMTLLKSEKILLSLHVSTMNYSEALGFF